MRRINKIHRRYLMVDDMEKMWKISHEERLWGENKDNGRGRNLGKKQTKREKRNTSEKVRRNVEGRKWLQEN